MESRSSSDLFALLGLPARFDLDAQVIEKAFHERTRDLHPDRFATAPANERVAALSKSRALNDAYQQLKKPVGRAEYMLEQAGVTIGDNERLDPTQIMEVLEAREELAASRGDAAKVEKLQAGMQERRRAAVEQLSALFAANDHEGVKRVLINLRYIDRYLEECDAALSEDD
ncbi:MAG TPA: Fe-S protein assembly co-chaperone HscB [Kofleriaceae bacterium]